MKKTRQRFIGAALLIIVAAICAFFGFFGSATANADNFYDPESIYDQSDRGEHAFYYEKFDVEYDIASNREISVREELTVYYNGTSNTGFMRDIPVNGGEQVKNVSVTELIKGKEENVDYSVYAEESEVMTSFITVDIGDYTQKRKTSHTYILRYTYCLTKAQEGANKLALNVIGVQSRRVESANVTLKLPEGYQSGTYVIGRLDYADSQPAHAEQINGRTVIALTDISLKYNQGITFDLTFADGALSLYTNFAPYWFIIAGVVLLILLFAVKFLAFNKNGIVPVVNFEAPEKMNPLMMGKLIDYTVNPEDITSMIFYWADKGYLKIDLTNQKDPALIRIVQSLPQGTPAYEVTLFNEMFRGKDVVQPSSLKYRFYKTIDKVSVMVNAQVKGVYSKPSVIVSVLFMILGGLVAGVAPFLLGITQISSSFFLLTPFIAMVPLLFVYASAHILRTNILKADKKRKVICFATILVAFLFALIFYMILTPSFIFGLVQKILLMLTSSVIVFSAVFIPCRTKEYTEKLNDIVGFRNFILIAEKDRLEKMIEDNPQFYYHILPYAQGLGVSDKWEEKFANITIEPPQWTTSSMAGDIISFHIINRMISNSLNSMSQNMNSRPSSSGSSGHGGFGGGHVGGGHGGGGSRGR